MPRKKKSPAPTLLHTTDTAPEAAFEAIRAEIEAIPIEALLPINLDIPYAVRSGLTAARNLERLALTIAKLPEFDPRPVMELRTYALALLYAHDRATEPGYEVDPLPALLVEATPLRDVMLRLAELLASIGLVSAERVAAIRSGHGHADTADDLLALGRLFYELWDRIHNNTLVTRAMVDRAISLAVELQDALAEREKAFPNPLVAPTDRRHVRAQAYTAFARVYSQAQRAVTFLRWNENDALQIVPSLYYRRSRRSEADDDLLDPSTVADLGSPAPPAAEIVAEARASA
jgi:hypothetical protein